MSALTEPRRIAIRMPRPLWIGVAAAMVAVAGALLVALRVHFRNVAIREVTDAGGSVELRPRGPDWLRKRVGDERMALLDEVIRVKLSHSRAKNETLAHLPRLPSVRRLDFNGTHVTDAGLAHLAGLTRLEWLWLADK